jgi:hypothetical protein
MTLAAHSTVHEGEIVYVGLQEVVFELCLEISGSGFSRFAFAP